MPNVFDNIFYKQVQNPDAMILHTCVRRMSESIEKRFCFDIQVEDRPGVIYTFQALNEDDRKSWMDIMDGKEPVRFNFYLEIKNMYISIFVDLHKFLRENFQFRRTYFG